MPATMARLAFIGLGVMGAPIARHLATAGHDVTVYNRTAEKAAAWVAKHGGRSAATPAEAATDQDAVLTCVGDDDDLAAVTLSEDGAFGAMREGAIFIDHTTVSADIARRLAAAADRRGLHAVDAPVSGGQAGAENGKLSIMCGGSAEAMALAEPLMQTYAARIVHIGGPGAGQTTKMVNQIAIAGVLQGVSEALRFAQASQLDLDKVLEAISGGAAQSWQMVNRWPTMARSARCARARCSSTTPPSPPTSRGGWRMSPISAACTRSMRRCRADRRALRTASCRSCAAGR